MSPNQEQFRGKLGDLRRLQQSKLTLISAIRPIFIREWTATYQSYKVKFELDARTNEISILSADQTGTPQRTQQQVTVPNPWILSRTNRVSYVSFAMPVDFWYVDGNPDFAQLRALRKNGPDRIGPVRIKADSIIPGGQKPS